jgi:hypothetical protein
VHSQSKKRKLFLSWGKFVGARKYAVVENSNVYTRQDCLNLYGNIIHGAAETNPHFPSNHGFFNAEEVRQHEQAKRKIRKLYKKPEVFEPLSATLETMWQERQTGSLIKSLPWPLHSPNLAHKISYIEDPCPMPTKPSLYTGGQDMMQEQRTKHINVDKLMRVEFILAIIVE